MLAELLLVAGAGVALVLILPRLTGFRSQRPAAYDGKGPAFDPRRHLNGPILCEGMIFGPTGRVTSRFVAQMEGTWTGNTGVLTERFRYDNGRTQDREWRLVLDGARLTAAADDLTGPARGDLAGPTVRMRYDIILPPEAGGHVLRVTDWMYLMDNGTILNRSQFTKFGIKVAELQATMRPLPREGLAAEPAPMAAE